VAAGHQTLGEAIDGGAASTSGDRHALRHLRTLFRWPRRTTLTPMETPVGTPAEPT
jgi:hypothetical protein